MDNSQTKLAMLIAATLALVVLLPFLIGYQSYQVSKAHTAKSVQTFKDCTLLTITSHSVNGKDLYTFNCEGELLSSQNENAMREIGVAR